MNSAQKILSTVLLVVLSTLAQGQIAVSDSAPSPLPDPSALFDLQSSERGLLIPRMTTAERDSIQNPATSLMIFNTTTNCFQAYLSLQGWSDVYCDCTNPPNAGFSIPSPIGQFSAVAFSAQSPGLTYSWSFQSGSPSTSSGQNPSVTWNTPGTYNVGLTVSDGLGCSSSQSSTITVNPCTPPSAAFTINPSIPIPNNAASFTPTYQGTGSFSWTFPNGSPSSSTAQNPSVTWSAPDTVTVSLSVTDSVGCSNSSSQSVFIPNCAPIGTNTATFNNTSTGRFGTVQTWTVPAGICNIQIEAWGAKGGGSNGGDGAYVKGEFSVTPGETISMMVGQMGGLTSQGNYVGGGGGGTFVYRNVNDPFPMIAAGGGGGQSQHAIGGDGSGTITPTSGSGGSGTAPGGTNGNGGGAGAVIGNYSSGSGGAGWLTNGGRGTTVRQSTVNTEGIAPRNGGQGGIFGHTQYNNADGGYGGGAGGVDNSGAGGGGGGWNGGGGANNYTSSQWGAGGGGGSYNGGTNQTNQTGVNGTHGRVVITY